MKVAVLAAVALSSALLAAAPVGATEILHENFADIETLVPAGWAITNESNPRGLLDWFQANEGIFPAQSGAAGSYIASNFFVSTPGGTLSNWLITPVFSTVTAGSVTFWIRGAAEDGFEDLFTYGFSTGSADTSAFATVSPRIAQGGWNAVTVAFQAGGAGATGRFAIAHVGPEPSSNYIGVDSISIRTADANAAVPEPATWGMMLAGFGLAGFALRGSRRTRATRIRVSFA